jgi:hypothetical protein
MRTFTRIVLASLCIALAACASTKVETSGARMDAPLCAPAVEPLSALVYWQPGWRTDQKEPALREAAAVRGIQDFFDSAPCVKKLEIRRLAGDAAAPADEELLRLAASAMPDADRVLFIVVRELGPKLAVGSAAIVEGGTEVVVELRVLDARRGTSMANFRTHWRHGGSFVIKGVGSLDKDMSAALRVVLMPETPAP